MCLINSWVTALNSGDQKTTYQRFSHYSRRVNSGLDHHPLCFPTPCLVPCNSLSSDGATPAATLPSSCTGCCSKVVKVVDDGLALG